MKLGFHGATTMNADLQTDVAATAHAGFATLELWAAKADRFLVDHSVADLNALLQVHHVAPMTFNAIELLPFGAMSFALSKIAVASCVSLHRPSAAHRWP